MDPAEPGSRWEGEAMEPDEWLAFFHILAAMAWVGAVIVMNVAMARAQRAPDRTTVLRVAGQFESLGPLLMGPSFLIVVGSGIWLVAIEDWAAFSQLWVWLSLVLVALSVLVSIYSGSVQRRTSRALGHGAAGDSEVLRAASRFVWLSRLDLAILVVIVWLMVAMPGA
jgi:uncharacterized membrane protein